MDFPDPKTVRDMVEKDKSDVALRSDFIGSVAAFRIMGYSKKEIAAEFGIDLIELDKIILTNIEEFRTELESRRNIMTYNFEAAVFSEMQKIFDLPNDQDGVLKEKVKLLNGCMSFVTKLQEKKVTVKNQTEHRKLTINFGDLSLEERKEMLANSDTRDVDVES